MFNLFSLFKKDKIWDFKGGIHPPEMKLQSSRTPMRIAQLPDEVTIPIHQHLGTPGQLCVKVGDHVLKGQALTRGVGRTLPVHASISGTVTAIEPFPSTHPSGLPEIAVKIVSDGKDEWREKSPLVDYQSQSKEVLLTRIHEAGIAGLGGAGFPTATKLKGGGDLVKTLIINAAECEPYITADDRLMQEHADEVIAGCQILMHILSPDEVLIGIEDNKPEAIAALKQALAALTNEKRIFIRVIPTKYPSGGAKQLTKILTGKEVPSGGRSSDIGVLMQNVGTVVAIKRAIIDDEPLIERVVTVTGQGAKTPGNFWARLGTPIYALIKQAGFVAGSEQMVIMGGPLMGFTLPDLNAPVIKITNCLLIPSPEEMDTDNIEEACIRCGQCVDACPSGLLPQQLYWFSKGKEHEKAQQHNLFDCIECGACAFVCPSNIPLVQYYRQEKAEIREIDAEAKRAAEAKARFEAKKIRMEREKLEREARHQRAAVKLDDHQQNEVQSALSRVKEKHSIGKIIAVKAGEQPDNAAAIAARKKRKEEARAKQAAKLAQQVPQNTHTTADAESDPRKAAVAAALARVKAKKAQQAQATTKVDTPAETQAEVETDPRKAAVAAALARVKAKKAQQAQATAKVDTPAETPAEVETDPRKAAVAAALARVKAKKAQQAQATAKVDTPTETPADAELETDPRKAAVAAAIARVKAKKAQQAQATAKVDTPAETPAEVETDPRKAAVAAAIARVKAKKAQQAQATAKVDTPAETPAEMETDPRKAAVAAAIARVKAKKAQQAQATAEIDTPAETQAEVETDPRKAAVAAAIARVKAKKAQQAQATAEIDTPAETQAEVETDPRKAAVAAAIARVKAKKAQQAQATAEIDTPAETPAEMETDPRKAAVAAAIARVKAKKEAQQRHAKEEVTLD
ncbi:electron transport complex subunit RsxC [Proteus mirabilis]|uniref:electron transport complex subunit RsxC n=1 Tax=Proteus mirabilis TaxID=584 RepID=UPI0007A5A647|nr:electron transport complex subunit RsxC [Proteus mirabilis]AZH05264.1 electron transport complex subunit RsxC [Proteus mirabilis]ELA8071816.1 electron transport complex subunit RsxC [Proteus mirabilis]ELJ9401531.1 electron transport complex subunit RsxC [Proteus mirabilis]ELJ9436055.1 electron transport complex subunit RsxC [Proteus mirabilis]ELS1786885.1 electron transport complex subunit RsxC [Proteus mirabilis]